MNPHNELKMLMSFEYGFGPTFTLAFERSAHLMKRASNRVFLWTKSRVIKNSQHCNFEQNITSRVKTHSSRLNKSSFYTYTLTPNGAAVYINSYALIVARHKLKT